MSDLSERIKMQARSHAMEARTANATIAEIYQLCSGGRGEPGNWHGAEPVRKVIEDRRQMLAAIDAAGFFLFAHVDGTYTLTQK